MHLRGQGHDFRAVLQGIEWMTHMNTLNLRNWLAERQANAIGIAARKSGEDRAGWLEDAEFFRQALDAVDAVLAERARCAKVCRDMHDAGAFSPADCAAEILKG
jgi:hypothetical protein